MVWVRLWLAIAVVTSPFHSSYERGCQEKILLHSPPWDPGMVTCIQAPFFLERILGFALWIAV